MHLVQRFDMSGFSESVRCVVVWLQHACHRGFECPNEDCVKVHGTFEEKQDRRLQALESKKADSHTLPAWSHAHLG